MPPGPDPEKKPPAAAPRPAPPPVPPAPPRPQGQRPPGQRPPRPGPRPPPRRPLAPPRPRQHHHGKSGRARIGLVVIFLLLRMADVFLLLIVPFGTPIPVLPTMFDSSFSATLAAIAVSVVPVGAPSLATPGIICSTLWTTALLVAIWRRQYWARVILVGLLGLATVLVILVISSLTPDSPLFTATLIRGLVTVGCGAYLIYSRDVHRLTSRERS